MNVEYSFSIGAVVIGIIIIALGALIVKYYNKLADNTGVGNYSRWRIVGFVAIGIGFLTMLNVPAYLLSLLVSVIMSGGF